ncbi:hydroxysqualene dehydroxylase HpnE [Microvirga massiliensis]|uniref:hydroxysqualene dehydroxylase HpnE n=1 Tax=Microvirga massiliensis TaxID=1033741 RepID=UPI0007C81674|nr:hydroxysqualene dehydroxylase HpnE [Microvirga massiliensis]
MATTVHIVGAGLAGLSAAVRLAEAGRQVAVYDAAKIAGGRCRSYLDTALGITIDNGNHLLLSGNWAALDFLARIGSPVGLSGPDAANFPFADLATGRRWTLRLNNGRLPWWILDARRRVPGSRAWNYFAPIRILRAPSSTTVGEAMVCAGPLYERLWRPVLLAALNTEPSEAAAGLAAQILRETLVAGGHACRPLIAMAGLSATFVEPALRFLVSKGASFHFGWRLRAIGLAEDRPKELDFGNVRIAIGPQDAVVLAVPAWVAPDLIPGLQAPASSRAIVNAHFRVEPPPDVPPVLGIIHGLTEWHFAYPNRFSVTISNADRLLDEPRRALARAIWREVSILTGLPYDLPPWQIVKERRATFAATPIEASKRPTARTRFRDLVLAGDWTATGLPATIEGAVRSGYAAASALSGASAAKQLQAEAAKQGFGLAHGQHPLRSPRSTVRSP